MNTVGQILSHERNAKSLSISDIANELKISKNIIIDLENDNIKNDTDIIFNIGHLRSYSNFLELDTDIVINKFKDGMKEINTVKDLEKAEQILKSKSN